MTKNQLEKIEFVEKKFMKIRNLINLEDAYYICDEVINNLDDELLQNHITDMMKAMGYNSDKIAEINQIIKQIQNN